MIQIKIHHILIIEHILIIDYQYKQNVLLPEHVTKNSNAPHITPPTRVPDDTLSSITLPLSSLVLTSKWT